MGRLTLEECSVGIICVTKENVTSPWLCFEAGALSKTKEAYTCTFLLDLKQSAVQPPLGTFQHTVAERDDVRKLVHTINNALDKRGEKSLKPNILDKIFDQFWGILEEALGAIRKIEVEGGKIPERSDREIISEILDIVRNQQRQGVAKTEVSSGRQDSLPATSREYAITDCYRRRLRAQLVKWRAELELANPREKKELTQSIESAEKEYEAVYDNFHRLRTELDLILGMTD